MFEWYATCVSDVVFYLYLRGNSFCKDVSQSEPSSSLLKGNIGNWNRLRLMLWCWPSFLKLVFFVLWNEALSAVCSLKFLEKVEIISGPTLVSEKWARDDEWDVSVVVVLKNEKCLMRVWLFCSHTAVTLWKPLNHEEKKSKLSSQVRFPELAVSNLSECELHTGMGGCWSGEERWCRWFEIREMSFLLFLNKIFKKKTNVVLLFLHFFD